MSNLTDEQIRNLQNDGYVITDRGGKTSIEKETPTGTVRYRMEDGVVQKIDSYYGNVRNPDGHDRVTVDVDTGKISGHDFEHKKW